MPVLVPSENGPPRRKKFAPKTRTGCVSCKARHVKCGEERPSCHRCDVSRLKCSYKIPKTWLFASKVDSSSDGDPRDFIDGPSPTSDDDDTSDTNKYTHQSASAHHKSVRTCHAWHGPRLFRAQHEYDAFSTWVTFLARHCAPRSKFPDNISPGQDVWRIVIPQIAYHSVALREIIIACGIHLLSVQRKHPQAQHDREMALVLSHATKAIHELASCQRPLIEVVLTAYTFWSLDTMSCRFQSAMIHGLSAVKIARQCRKVLASDQLALMFVQHMVFNLPGPDAAPLPEFVKDPPEIRRMEAVVLLEVEHDRVMACAQRVVMGNAPDRHHVLAILEESRQEVQWILSRYNTPALYAKWLLHKTEQAADEDRKTGCLRGRPGFYQKLVEKIDGYFLTANIDGMHTPIPVDLWRKDSAQETLMFMVIVAGTDLSLRHITVEFFEASRQIRWPGR